MLRGRSREQVSNARFEYERITKKKFEEVFSSFNWKVVKEIFYLCFTYVIWGPNNALLNSVLIVLDRWKTRERWKAMAAHGEKGNSLRRRGNQTAVSNVCETFPRSLFWPPDELNELPEVRFEFPFILIGKSTMAFLTGQSWCILKSWYIGGSPDQGLWRCFADGLIQSLLSFLARVRSETAFRLLITLRWLHYKLFSPLEWKIKEINWVLKLTNSIRFV